MSAAVQGNYLRDLLEAWTAPRGGATGVASNLRDMWQQASQASQKPIVLICLMGERVRGPFATGAVCRRVDRQWAVAVVRGRGFNYVRGDSLTDTVGQCEPLYDAVEAIRDLIRGASAMSAEFPVDYKGIRPMQMGNTIIDGYLIEFSTAHDLTVVTE